MAQTWMSKTAVISKLVENAVHSVFCEFTLEAYTGQITTDDVLSVVEHSLAEFGFTMDEQARGEALDQIRLQGPTCEKDDRWFSTWCGEPTPASIGAFGKIA